MQETKYTHATPRVATKSKLGERGFLLSSRIFIGTSGYSYDDWRGAFYPLRIKREEMLRHYTKEFSFTEINSSYYHLPSFQFFLRLAEKTPSDFLFTVKAHKSLTHERGGDLKATSEKFRSALKPLIETGKLGAILLQFPYSFKNCEENRKYLLRLRELMGELPLAVEFRHTSWEQKPVWDFLRMHEIAYVSVDEPQIKGLLGRSAVLTSSIGYVRFHGRNAEKWWKHEESYERYDYLYTEEELREWVPKIKSLSNGAKQIFVAFNNHYRGKAVINAKMLQKLLTE